jgi:hypothetical protein
VEYSTDFVYITTEDVPAYPIGPFTDNNSFVTTAQAGLFKFPLNPVQETGTPMVTTGGRIGVFVNGVSLFDYRDGVAWNNYLLVVGGTASSSVTMVTVAH